MDEVKGGETNEAGEAHADSLGSETCPTRREALLPGDAEQGCEGSAVIGRMRGFGSPGLLTALDDVKGSVKARCKDSTAKSRDGIKHDTGDGLERQS